MLILQNKICRARPLLGTFVEITITNTPNGGSETAINAAFDAVALVHRLMSFHEPSSDISRLNLEAWKAPVAVHPWTYRVLEAAIDLNQRSLGVFDISIACALQELDLLPGNPCAEKIPFGLSEVIVLLPNDYVFFNHPAIRIDLGGIAKGFAVDQAVAVLKEHGIHSGLVNAGGDMFAFGQQAYRAYIRHPRKPAQLISQVEFRDEALASSGNCFDPFPIAIRPESAVIDPRAGIPANAVIAVSVRASSCMMADALTKIVMIEGEDSMSLLDFYQASALCVFADGDILCTSNWQIKEIESPISMEEFEKVVNQ